MTKASSPAIEKTSLKTQSEEIFTESDKILENFRRDLDEINLRVQVLEEERSHFQEVLEKTNQKFEQSLLQGHFEKKINQGQKEDLMVIDRLFDDLKTPIHAVVNSLGNIQTEIEDEQLKNSLNDCWQTAKEVLGMFNSSQKFIQGLVEEDQAPKQGLEELNFREYLKNFLINLQEKRNENWNLRLFFDSRFAERFFLFPFLVDESLSVLLPELYPLLLPNQTWQLHVMRRKIPNAVVDAEQLILSIQAEPNFSNPTAQAGSEQPFFSSEKNFPALPFAWMKLKKKLLNHFGDLKIIQDQGKVKAVEVWLPFR